MNISSMLGLIGTLIGLVRALPQLIHLLRAKEACGVSVDTAATSSIVGFGWAVYGFGIILPVSVLVSNIPQIWVAYKEDDLSDLSLGIWLLSMSDGLYGELIRSSSMILQS
jgi:hypothetical protein